MQRDKNIIVIGGGDTAYGLCKNCCEAAMQNLIKCLYRRDKENMPGSLPGSYTMQ